MGFLRCQALSAASLLLGPAAALLSGTEQWGNMSYQPQITDTFGANQVNVVTTDAAGKKQFLPSDNQAGTRLNSILAGEPVVLRIGIQQAITSSPPDYKTMYRLPLNPSPVPDWNMSATFDIAFRPGPSRNGFLLFQWWQGVGSPRMCINTCPPISVSFDSGANGTAFRLILGYLNQYQGAASTYRSQWVTTMTWHTMRVAVRFSPTAKEGKIYAWMDGYQYAKLDNITTGFPSGWHGRNAAVSNAFGVYLNAQNVLVDTYVDFSNVSYYPYFLNAPF